MAKSLEVTFVQLEKVLSLTTCPLKKMQLSRNLVQLAALYLMKAQVSDLKSL